MLVKSNMHVKHGLTVDKYISNKIQNLGEVSGLVEIDFAQGSQISCTLTDDATFTFLNAISGARYVFYIITNDYNVILPAEVASNIANYAYFALDYNGINFYATETSTLISATYEELSTLKTSNLLVQNQNYLLTNYYTKYIQPLSNTLKHCHYSEGDTFDVSTLYEPIILTAISNNEFHIITKSTIHNDDLIEYDFDDNICEDDLTTRRGFITRRTNTIKRISTPFDFRNLVWTRDITDYRNMTYDGSVNWKEFYTFNTDNTLLNFDITNVEDIYIGNPFKTYLQKLSDTVIFTNFSLIADIKLGDGSVFNTFQTAYQIHSKSAISRCEFATTNRLTFEYDTYNIKITGSVINICSFIQNAVISTSGTYHKQIFTNANGQIRLLYYDEFDNTRIIDPTI